MGGSVSYQLVNSLFVKVPVQGFLLYKGLRNKVHFSGWGFTILTCLDIFYRLIILILKET